MLESLRPEEYLTYRDAAAAIFARHDGDAAIQAFGLEDVLRDDSPTADLAPAYAFLEAQGYQAATTSTLGQLGLVGLSGQVGAAPAAKTLLLASLLGAGPRVAVPGLTAASAVAVDLAGSGLVLINDVPVAGGARPDDHPTNYLTVIDIDRASLVVLVADREMDGLRTAMRARTQLGAAAELVGLCDRILDDALTYARARRQFGRAVTDFQAIQHMLAWAAAERHQLVCLFDLAVIQAAAGRIDPLLSQAVKAMAGRVVHAIIQAATQATGAISFTWEYSLNGLHRRVLALDQLAGASADLVTAMGRRLRVEGVVPDLLELISCVDSTHLQKGGLSNGH